MSVKERISNNYIDEMKYIHLNKFQRKEMFAIVTGSNGNCPESYTNIGSSISIRLRKDFNAKIIEYDKLESEKYDVNEPSFLNRFSDVCEEHSPNVLILSHGVSHLEWFEDYLDYQYEEIIRTNLLSYMFLINRFVNKTIESKFIKYIVVIGSMAYKNVLNGSIPYMVSKAGLAHLVSGLAWELAPKNYNVVGIHPANVENTPMSQDMIRKISNFRNIDRDEANEYWRAICPKQFFVTKDQISELVSLFLSSKIDHLSGANIEMKGGQR